MLSWNRIYKELVISVDGLRKSLLEIAITMSENTQIAKLLYQIFELEKKIDKLHIKTGQTVHELHQLPFSEITANEKVKENVIKLKSLQSDINRLEKEINLLREERVKSRLDELTRYMRRGGYTIEDFIVAQDSDVINKSIGELFLPHGGIIVAVIHDEKLIMPQNGIKFAEGDRVFILSPVNAVKETSTLFTSSKQLT
ncbi:MAG: TrkA C-terminal domain-containing protein [Nitrospirota bacterium]